MDLSANTPIADIEPGVDPPCVVLLHGLGRTRLSMWWVGRWLRKHGFAVVNVGYPALRYPVQELADRYLPPALAACDAASGRPVHFVTHSLGAIVLRQYLQNHPPPAQSRAVMLAPPNRGSEIADELRDLGPYRRFLGPSGQQLGTDEHGLPGTLGPVEIEIGIVAGRRNVMPLLGRYLPGESDGKVTVRSTALEEMEDFLVVDAGHTFIMYHPTVLRAVVRFLESGSFGESP